MERKLRGGTKKDLQYTEKKKVDNVTCILPLWWEYAHMILTTYVLYIETLFVKS